MKHDVLIGVHRRLKMASYQKQITLGPLAKRLEISVSQEILLAADKRRSTPIKPSLFPSAFICVHPRPKMFFYQNQ